MRAGRASDLPGLIALWRQNVQDGRQDAIPDGPRLRKTLAAFDWDARSRVTEDSDERVTGSVLVSGRPSPEGVISTMYLAGHPDATEELARWGVLFSRAAGASVVQVTIARGHGSFLAALGLRSVRPWWRMDRNLRSALPPVAPIAGYRLLDGSSAAPGLWEEIFNRAFADHWRFSPRTQDEITADRTPALCLAALASEDGEPAAITFGELQTYSDDSRQQPVGLLSHVGTLPGHRRRGLATWLVTEAMRRLRDAGAAHYSLYVDGANPTRAFDIYKKLGFELAFEAEVWEASLQ
ncbi:MAG TPA: GNAT family N-acetyltransferase [Candidatus Dormibacteraeota bacterium]